MTERATIEIDLERVRENTAILKKRSGAKEFMAVVKADGYGHGAANVAHAAVKGGATWMGVATVEEGIEITAEGINTPILVLSEPPLNKTYVDDMLHHELTPVVYTIPFINMLPEGMQVHLKVDTGMHRVGVFPSEVEGFVSYIRERKLKLTGLMTHFAAAERDSALTYEQNRVFSEVAMEVDDGVLFHAANTYGVLYHPTGYDMARCGLGIYGLVGAEFGLKPALSFTSVLRNVRWFPASTRLSYDQVPMQNDGYVGVVPVGYGDGIPRKAGGRGWVAVGGMRYPIIAVTMDLMLIGLGRSVLEVGTPIEIVGPNISVDEWAATLDVIPYEFVTGLKRVKRIWK